MDAVVSVIAFFFLVGLAFFGLIRSPAGMQIIAHLAVTPQSIERLRRAISDDCSDYDMADQPPAEAEDTLAERTRHTIGRTLAEINPRNPIAVTKTWPPTQRVIITGDTAVIAPSIGWLVIPHSRIEPLKVRVKRATVVTLDNRPSLKAVHDAIYEPPAKVAINARPAAAKPAPTPPTKPVPVKRPSP